MLKLSDIHIPKKLRCKICDDEASCILSDICETIQDCLCHPYKECVPEVAKRFAKHILINELEKCYGDKEVVSKSVPDFSVKYKESDDLKYVSWMGYRVDPSFLDKLEPYLVSDDMSLYGRICINACKPKGCCK